MAGRMSGESQYIPATSFFVQLLHVQVIEERITHIPYVPSTPEPLNVPTGNELKPRPVGEENGIVVFTYCPISAVNYVSSK